MLKDHEYAAPDCWGAISNDLTLSDQVGKLKSFKVKKDLWSGIEDALDTQELVEVSKRKVNSFKKYWPFAILLLVGAISISIFLLRNSQTQHFVYTSEVEITNTTYDTPTADIGNYQIAQKFIDSNKFMFSENSLIEFNEELLKLDKAIEDIKSVQEQYGLDDSMIKLLSKMEREKATLIKSMINRT